MEIQNSAVNIIESISQRLDPLFSEFNVQIKFRESRPAVIAECLTYEKDGIQIEITACLHPHDYPNSLSIQCIDKNYHPWKYSNHSQLLDMAQQLCGSNKTDLQINTDTDVEVAIENLYEIMRCILKNIYGKE